MTDKQRPLPVDPVEIVDDAPADVGIVVDEPLPEPEPAIVQQSNAPRAGTLERQLDDALDPSAARGLWPLARELSMTEFVPSSMRGKPAQVLAAILTGRELGIGAMRSLAHISIVKGRPRLSAALQLALVRQAGHRVEGSSDAQRAEITGTRKDTAETMTVVWTIEDAQRATLVDSVDDAGKARARSKSGEPLPWESYTPKMLWWRAVTELVDRLFSDVVTFGPGDD